MLNRRTVLPAVLAACLIAGLALPAISASGIQKNRKSDRESGEQEKPKLQEIIWTDPGNIAEKDLFYGPGGPDGAPDSEGIFKFIRRSDSGTSEKIIVEDERGRKWTVKFGSEAKPETASTRIVWAVGYHVDQDYFVRRASIEGRGGFVIGNVRFERRDDGFKDAGNWAWESNPFNDTRELQGLKVLMALLNNWDVKTGNNKIVRSGEKKGSGRAVFYVSDLGATLGVTGTFLNRVPLFRDFAADRSIGDDRSKGDAGAFANEPFIEGIRNGEVIFHHKRKRGREMLRGIRIEHAVWIGQLLGQLSDRQLSDAFRAGGFEEDEVALFVSSIRKRIIQLQNLRNGTAAR